MAKSIIIVSLILVHSAVERQDFFAAEIDRDHCHRYQMLAWLRGSFCELRRKLSRMFEKKTLQLLRAFLQREPFAFHLPTDAESEAGDVRSFNFFALRYPRTTTKPTVATRTNGTLSKKRIPLFIELAICCPSGDCTSADLHMEHCAVTVSVTPRKKHKSTTRTIALRFMTLASNR